jgi:Tfp pilus assembly protein PilV
MTAPIAVSTLAIVLIAVGAVILVAFVLGLLGARARYRSQAPSYDEHVAAADQALEEARAADKGWHRDAMEQVARDALAESRPGWKYRALHLILVDDKPGVDEDRAHFVAVADDGEAHVTLARQPDGWVAERVE